MANWINKFGCSENFLELLARILKILVSVVRFRPWPPPNALFRLALLRVVSVVAKRWVQCAPFRRLICSDYKEKNTISATGAAGICCQAIALGA
jgi:hypothetical protein